MDIFLSVIITILLFFLVLGSLTVLVFFIIEKVMKRKNKMSNQQNSNGNSGEIVENNIEDSNDKSE